MTATHLFCSLTAKLRTPLMKAQDRPDRALVRGQVGTILDVLAPGVFEVEFSDEDGRAYAQLTLKEDERLVLHYAPQEAA
jgi:hypothetical protein